MYLFTRIEEGEKSKYDVIYISIDMEGSCLTLVAGSVVMTTKTSC